MQARKEKRKVDLQAVHDRLSGKQPASQDIMPAPQQAGPSSERRAPKVKQEAEESFESKQARYRSKKSSPLNNTPFNGEKVFATTYGMGGGFYPNVYNKHTNHCLGFTELVNAQYDAFYAHDRKFGAVLPRPLFNYACGLALIRRMLCLSHANRAFIPKAILRELTALEALGDLTLPKAVVQYLRGMGNFKDAAGMQWFYSVPVPWEKWNTVVADVSGHVGQEHWAYTCIPTPYVLTQCILAHMGRQVTENWALPAVDPDLPGITRTPEILGYMSARPFNDKIKEWLTSLGWSQDNVPPDARWSLFNVSTSTIEQIDIRMKTLPLHLVETYRTREFSIVDGSVAQTIYNAFPTKITRSGEFNTAKRSCIPTASQDLKPSQWFLGSCFMYKIKYELGNTGGMQGWYHRNFPVVTPTSWMEDSDTSELLRPARRLGQMSYTNILTHYIALMEEGSNAARPQKSWPHR